MQKSRTCKYANECLVYKGEIDTKVSSTTIIRNVFCNRGIKGWSNCKKFQALEQDQPVSPEATPYTV